MPTVQVQHRAGRLAVTALRVPFVEPLYARGPARSPAATAATAGSATAGSASAPAKPVAKKGKKRRTPNAWAADEL